MHNITKQWKVMHKQTLSLQCQVLPEGFFYFLMDGHRTDGIVLYSL